MADTQARNGHLTKVIDPSIYDTDKRQYWKNYEELFRPLVGKEIRLLELGVHKGGSLILWRDYFEHGIIVGLDVNPVQIEDPTCRIHVYQGFQQDTDLLDRIGQETAPGGYDVIIDDASHIGTYSRISFWHLFNKWLKPGGIFVIEDWGTGYWDIWPDGRRFRSRPRLTRRGLTESIVHSVCKGSDQTRFTSAIANTILRISTRWFFASVSHSHNFGMVGFIKELVDECGMADVTDPDHGISPHRASLFAKMHIYPGQVYIVKR